jgi:hypothetical protein
MRRTERTGAETDPLDFYFGGRMIKFYIDPNDKNKVVIEFDPLMKNKKVGLARWDCAGDWYAELLAQRLNNRMAERLREIRREAYDAGWKDARTKKTVKSDWFSEGW